MEIKISATELSSFVGDVRPVWLMGDEDLKYAKIKWKLEGDAVKMKTFRGAWHGCFNYGVLLTFVKEGSARVVAELEEQRFECEVHARARRDFSGEKMEYYVGDLHTHTSREHSHDKFITRTEQRFPDYLNYIKNENKRDFAVITDHAVTIDKENFFGGFSTYEQMKEEMEPIVYPGCENEIAFTDEDRFGQPYRYSGELLAFNTTSYGCVHTYEEFFYVMQGNPYAIGIFAHPHVIGGSTRGVWNYRPRLNHPKQLTELVKYIEVFGKSFARVRVQRGA